VNAGAGAVAGGGTSAASAVVLSEPATPVERPAEVVRQRRPVPQRWMTPRAIGLACLAAYLVLAVLAFAPVSPFSTSSLPTAGNGNPAGSDALQMTWFLAYFPYAVAHGVSLFHTNLIDYPGGVNLADNTSLPVLGLLASPVTLTLGPVAAFNVLIRLSFALSAGSMYLVLGRWCSSWQARFAGGLLYGFGPYMAGQAMHLDLVFVPIPALLLLLGDELLRRRRMRAPLLGLAIGGCAAVQYLISPDVLSGCGVMAVIVGAGLAIRHRDLVRPSLPYLGAVAAAALGVFVLVCGYPIYEMLAGPAHLTGPVLAVSNLQSDSADLLGPIVPTSTQLLTPPAISHLGDYLVGGNLSESGSYLGIPLLIALVLIVRRLRGEADVLLFACAAIAAYVMSLGGHLVTATWRSPLPLPGDVPAHLPLLEDTIPARYALYVTLFLAVVLAIGVERLVLRGEGPVGGRSGRRRAAVLGLLIVVTLLPDAPFKSAPLTWSPSLPATLERLLPPGAVVAADPGAQLGHAGPMTWQAIDAMSFRLIGGYANIAMPGEPFGTKSLEPPPFFRAMPQPPQQPSGLARPGVIQEQVAALRGEEAELRSYLSDNSVTALVFTGFGAPTDGEGTIGYDATARIAPSSYWFLDSALGPPSVVGAGFVIWLEHAGSWEDPTGA
jgi:hypothetical protein